MRCLGVFEDRGGKPFSWRAAAEECTRRYPDESWSHMSVKRAILRAVTSGYAIFGQPHWTEEQRKRPLGRKGPKARPVLVTDAGLDALNAAGLAPPWYRQRLLSGAEESYGQQHRRRELRRHYARLAGGAHDPEPWKHSLFGTGDGKPPPGVRLRR